MMTARAGERQQFRLMFTAFPAASVPVSAAYALLLGAPGTDPVPVLWLLGIGLVFSQVWTTAVWWPLWRWFRRNGFSGLVLVPFRTGAGALLCLPFIVLSPFIGGGFLVPLFTGLFGAIVGTVGGLAAAAVEGVRRLRETE